MMQSTVPAQPQSAEVTLTTERNLDVRLIKMVIKAGGLLFLAFIVALAFG